MRQLRSITLSRSKSPFYPHGTYTYSFGLLATVDLRVYIFLFLWIVPFSLSDLHARMWIASDFLLCGDIERHSSIC